MRLVLFLLLVLLLSGCGASSVIQKIDYMSGDFTGCAVGAYVNGVANLPGFQTLIGKNLAVVLSYVHWQDPFPSAEADIVAANHSIPLITWEPWITDEAGNLNAISTGYYESYVREFIQAAKDWGKPLFLRFAHEMNGNWYPWDGLHNGQDPGKYKQAWIYIYSVREELAADNVYLVWSPNNANMPEADWNVLSAYYPGDQYVDWIGMDGYNWGYADWGSFESVFGDVYQTLAALTDKPLMIGEFASAEQGGSKAGWITDALAKIKAEYPRIKIFCWFNIDKERDWRVTSSATAETSFNQALQDGYFLDKIR